MSKQASEWLKEVAAREQPWCLYVGLVAPHFPLVVPEEFYALYPPGLVPEPRLHPRTGYVRHPWVEKYAQNNRSEELFTDEDERRRAFSAYYGLCSWMDARVGDILGALEQSGAADRTTVIYTSDPTLSPWSEV